jgi:hypothetical protein
MAKTFATSNSKPGAWIVSPNDRGRKSIKSGKVFLNDSDEFEIELFNPLNVSVLADIKLNNQSISKSGLVLKPGQRVYLDCFIDDRKKFVFKTYEVENTTEISEAIRNNGLLEVYFYKEEVITINNWQNKFQKVIIERYPYWYYPVYPSYPTYPTIWYGSTGGTTFNTNSGTITTNSSLNLTGGITNTSTSTSYYSSAPSTYTSNSIETGRIEKGEKSNQKFTDVDMSFESFYISSTVIQILPESRKPDTASDVVKKLKTDRRITKIDVATGNWPHHYQKNSESIIEMIKKLAELHKEGILTDDEFSSKKAELLEKI